MIQLAFLISCPSGKASLSSRKMVQHLCFHHTLAQAVAVILVGGGQRRDEKFVQWQLRTKFHSFSLATLWHHSTPNFLWLHERAPRNPLDWIHYENNKAKFVKKCRDVQHCEYLVTNRNSVILWKIRWKEIQLSLCIFLSACVWSQGVKIRASAISSSTTHFPGSVNGNWVLKDPATLAIFTSNDSISSWSWLHYLLK